jgi:hypothetical protein
LILLIKDIYVSFFIRPDLFIEVRDDEPATFRPELQIPDTKISRQYLKVRVVNRGKGVATDCIAKFRITGWTGNTRHPSTDSKILRWDDGSHNKLIYPRGEEEVLNVIFADSDLQQLAEQAHQDIYAFVATNDALNYRMYRAQDGFGQGDFEAEISIRSKEWGYCLASLTIHVDHERHNLSIRLSRWDRIILAYKRRPSIVRFISRYLRQWLR